MRDNGYLASHKNIENFPKFYLWWINLINFESNKNFTEFLFCAKDSFVKIFI